MDELHLTTEDLNKISEMQAEKESQETYTERPRSHRILAWICIAVMVVGIFFYCYWQIVPQ